MTRESEVALTDAPYAAAADGVLTSARSAITPQISLVDYLEPNIRGEGGWEQMPLPRAKAF